MSEQDMDPGINASLGRVNKVCAGLAIRALTHAKAQRWLAERCPNEIKFSGPRLLTTNGETDFLWDHGENHDYYATFKGNPIFEEACARRYELDAKAFVGLSSGEKVVFYSIRGMPDDYDLIVDWLNAMAENNRVILLILPALSWATVAGIAREWDRQSNRGMAA